MTLPAFTAEASLYRTGRHYRVAAGATYRSSDDGGLSPAWDDHACSNCLEQCLQQLGWCLAGAGVSTIFCPPCGGAALAACDTESVSCIAVCNLPGNSCCPTFCHPGKCCGPGETCVDSQPTAWNGCCPAGQAVCNGHCCAPGDTCCGGECCPAGYFCTNGFCSSSVPFGTGHPDPPPDPTTPITCHPGETPCWNTQRWVCCPPGKECCGARGCQGTCVA